MDYLMFSSFTSLFNIVGSFCSLNKDMPVSPVLGPLLLAFSTISFMDLPLSQGFNQHQSADFSSVFAWSGDPSPALHLSPLMVCQEFLLAVLQFFISLIFNSNWSSALWPNLLPSWSIDFPSQLYLSKFKIMVVFNVFIRHRLPTMSF